MAGDPRYNTGAWQRTRKYVIARDQVCMLQTSPRCNGRAETAHHTLPTSQYPEAFFAVDCIVASCKPCNFADGARIKAANQRQTVGDLRALVEQQWQQIQELQERLAAYEGERSQPAPPQTRQLPAIY
jgi:5-methylcytosine-specific restriction endonuclease McrA